VTSFNLAEKASSFSGTAEQPKTLLRKDVNIIAILVALPTCRDIMEVIRNVVAVGTASSINHVFH